MIHVATGVCGSGKSYLLMMLVAAELGSGRHAWRFLVVDVNHEWPGVPADVESKRRGAPLEFHLARTPHEALTLFQSGAECVILRPAPAASEKDSRELGNAAAWVCLQIGPKLPAGQGCCLVLPEMHEYAREHQKLPDHLRTIVHRFRHTRTGLLGDTQHAQDIKKEILREAETVYFLAQSHPTDLAVVERYGGHELREAVEEVAERFAKGEKGWRIEYRQHLGGPPPFEPVR